MNKINAYNFITLNGFFKAADGSYSWQKHGKEEAEFAADSAKSDNILLFGRVTFEMMAGYWPTPNAAKNDPEVAKGMNSKEKIVFSNTLKETNWENSTIINGDIFEKTRKLKENGRKDMTILGSGTIITQFADHGLLDELTIMLNPVAIGKGTPLLNGIKDQLDLELTESKAFKSGVVLLSYKVNRSK